jgi:hypothetical protein
MTEVLARFDHGKEHGYVAQWDDGSYHFSIDTVCSRGTVDPRDGESVTVHLVWPTLDGLQNLAMLAQDLTECTNDLVVNELEGTPDA